MYKTRKMEINRFRQEAGDRLGDSFKEFLDEEWMTRKVPFSYGLKEDKKTFVYGDSCRVREITLSFVDQFREMGRAVFYDYLYEQHNFDVFQLDSLYRKNLEKTGMNGLSGILLRDSVGQVLEVTGVCEGEIRTVSVEAGYRCRHRIEAVFQLPLIFRSMIWHLVGEGMFFFAFIGCLVWLWKAIRLTWQSANVQTMGIAHLEHELKKPLAAVTSALEGIVNRKNRELTAIQEEKLKMVEVRIRKMAETLGFGTATQLAPGLLGASGTLPDAAALENPGELATFSFGQGALTVTPLQITAMMNTVANGGVYRTPAFVQGIVDADGTLTGQTRAADTRTVFDAATARVLRSMLASVVSEGIGSEAQPKTGTAGGKTGTAQTGQYDENGEELLNYWFSGFYPADDPRYTITVLQDGILKPETSSAAIFAKVTEILAVWENS